LFQLVPPDTRIDFLGKSRFAAAFSLAILVAGLVAIPIRGIRTGIDFSGGTELQLRFEPGGPVDEGAIRRALGEAGVGGADVIRFGGGEAREYLLRMAGEIPLLEGAAAAAPAAEPEAAAEQAAPAAPGAEAAAEPAAAPPVPEPGPEPAAGELSPDERRQRLAALEGALESKLGPLEVERVEFVGPRVGAELRRDGLLALVFSWIVILGYVGFRFSIRYGPGAVVALMHDVLVTASVWVILGLEFDLQVLAALLTIIGYSVNDTIVIFDRVRENLTLRTKRELEEVVNRSLNETLSRTLLTAGTVFLSCLALVLLGGPVIRPFSLAMCIGVVAGSYSTIYMAAPVMIWLEERYGRRAASAPARAQPAPRA
jgi:preprotein translocase subunit SecF